MNMKQKLAAIGGAFGAVALSVPALAEGSNGTANSAVTGAMTTVAADMVATGNAVVPIALTVVGISLVVVFGVRLFRRIAK